MQTILSSVHRLPLAQVRVSVEENMALTVLLVEDHPDVLEITAYMLEDGGYDVLCASGSEQARELVSSHGKIDMVITDLHLAQGVNGVEMGLDMRRRGLDCPLLVMSGGDEPEQALREARMSYLSKPFTQQSLLLKVSELAGDV
jgi:DNA-binding NtrC family response regulator